jgi:hypothetical protein
MRLRAAMRARIVPLRCAETHVAQFPARLEVIAVVHVHVEWLKMWTSGPRTRSAMKNVHKFTGSLASPLHAPFPSSSTTNLRELEQHSTEKESSA